MVKRGSSQVDWAISLAVFLLYIAWFFIFVTPVSEKAESVNLISLVKDPFIDFINYDINRSSLFVYSNDSHISYPLIVDFPFEKGSFFLDNNSFLLYDSRLFFLDNLSNGSNIFSFIFSDKNYSIPSVFNAFYSNQNFSSSYNFKVYFIDSLISAVDFPDKKINNLSYFLDSLHFSSSESFFIDSSFASIYKVSSEVVNISQVVFSNHSSIYNFLDLNKEGDFSFRLSFDLFKYPNFFSDNLYNGAINYSINEHFSYFSDRLTFLSNSSALTLLFPKEVLFSVSHSNVSNLFLNISFSFNDDFSYEFFFHNHLSEVDSFIDPYSFGFGASEVVSGVSLDILPSDYSVFKSDIDFPVDKDFSIFIINSSGDFIFNISHPILPDSNVYSDNSFLELLDGFGRTERVSLLVKTW